nr:hypothetical protein [Rhodococcus qingshengii]
MAVQRGWPDPGLLGNGFQGRVDAALTKMPLGGVQQRNTVALNIHTRPAPRPLGDGHELLSVMILFLPKRMLPPNGVHILDHVGEFFKVRCPLNVGHSPQGRPDIVHTGSSAPELEKTVAAHHRCLKMEPEI